VENANVEHKIDFRAVARGHYNNRA